MTIISLIQIKSELSDFSRKGSGGYRVLVGYRKPNAERIIFLYAFAKSERANISVKEEAALSLAAEAFVSTTETQVQELMAIGSIWEIKRHD